MSEAAKRRCVEEARAARERSDWAALREACAQARARGWLSDELRRYEQAAAFVLDDHVRRSMSLGESLWSSRFSSEGPAVIDLLALVELRMRRGDEAGALALLVFARRIAPESAVIAAELLKLLDNKPWRGRDSKESLLATAAEHEQTADERARARWALASYHAERGKMTDAADEAAKALAEAPARFKTIHLEPHELEEVFAAQPKTELAIRALIEKTAESLSEDDALNILDDLQLALEEPSAHPELQMQLLDAVLDKQPSALRAFELQTQLLAGMRAWPALAQAYHRMLNRLSNAEVAQKERLLGLLWFNLGELYRHYLKSPRDAVHALRMAFQYEPTQDVRAVLIEAIGLLGGEDLDTPSLEAMVAVDPLKARSLEELATRLLKDGVRDRGVLLLRVAVATGSATPKARKLLAKHDRAPGALEPFPYPRSARAKWSRLASADSVLETLFAGAYELIGHYYEADLSKLSPRIKGYLDQKEDLLFQRIWRRMTEAWGYSEPPPVALHEGTQGLRFANSPETLFLLNPSLLSGWSEDELVFVVARALMLAQSRFILPDQLAAARCFAIAGAMILSVDPEAPIESRPSVVSLARHASRAMTDHWREPLELAVERVLADGLLTQIEPWMARVSREADRIALLYCDSPHAASRVIAKAEDSSSDPTRQGDLLTWAVSESWTEMRSEIGLALS